jgi:AraC-like DNA-binding protein
VRDRRKLDEARRLVEHQFDEPWTIPLLARKIGLNERKLKLGFRTMMGRSIHAYLRDTRIEAASAMLVQGRRVTDVAVAIGFGSISPFSKIAARRGSGGGPVWRRLAGARSSRDCRRPARAGPRHPGRCGASRPVQGSNPCDRSRHPVPI